MISTDISFHFIAVVTSTILNLFSRKSSFQTLPLYTRIVNYGNKISKHKNVNQLLKRLRSFYDTDNFITQLFLLYNTTRIGRNEIRTILTQWISMYLRHTVK